MRVLFFPVIQYYFNVDPLQRLSKLIADVAEDGEPQLGSQTGVCLLVCVEEAFSPV